MKGWPNCQAKSSTAFVLPQGRSHSGVTKSDYLELSRAWLRPTFRPVFPSLHESDYGATSNLLLSCGIEIFGYLVLASIQTAITEGSPPDSEQAGRPY